MGMPVDQLEISLILWARTEFFPSLYTTLEQLVIFSQQLSALCATHQLALHTTSSIAAPQLALPMEDIIH